MKFWPCALILSALLLGGWVATHPPARPPEPEWLGHYSGLNAQGRELEIVLSSSTDHPGGVEGRWRSGGEGTWEIGQGTVQRSTITLFHEPGKPALTGRFQEEPDGTRVLQVGAARLVLVITHSTFRLEQPRAVVQCVHPRLIYPRPALRRAVEEARADAVEEARRVFSEIGEDQDESVVYPWDYSETWNVSVCTDTVVSLFGYGSSYLGGAHGNTHFGTRTFWWRDGEVQELRLADLFSPCMPWQDVLTDLVTGQVRAAGASAVADDSGSRLDERDLQNWTMTRRGIEFHFEPYRLGCYAEGAYYAFVKYEDIRELLNPVGPAAELLR